MFFRDLYASDAKAISPYSDLYTEGFLRTGGNVPTVFVLVDDTDNPTPDAFVLTEEGGKILLEKQE
jgi:hypothetical protein